MSEQQASMTEQQASIDSVTRMIVLVYGIQGNGSPFWVYVAVKPTRYQAMQNAQKEGTLDLNDFASYGEVIIAGHGQSPPDEVTLKVAETYQTTPEMLKKATEQ
jgi:hypothetical protein